VEHVIAELNGGTACAWPPETAWAVDHAPVDQKGRAARLSAAKTTPSCAAGDLGFYDKVPTKFSHLDEAAMKASGVRVVPPAVARRGSYLG